MFRILAGAIIGLAASSVHAHPDTADDASAHYLANEAVMVVQGDTKVLFDPLFHSDVGGYYLLVPSEMRAAMMAGEAPYDGIDAVFVSHAHGDHFAAADMNTYLGTHQNVQLFAPAEAVAAMRQAPNWDSGLVSRISPISLAYGDAPAVTRYRDVSVTAVRIPHAGGARRRSIENMAFRVTLGDGVTVMHLGDADPDEAHFNPYAIHWANLVTDMAFVPDWFFSVFGGTKTKVLLNAQKVVGVHVAVNVPPGLVASGEDYFSTPGEFRVIKPHTHD